MKSGIPVEEPITISRLSLTLRVVGFVCPNGLCEVDAGPLWGIDGFAEYCQSDT